MIKLSLVVLISGRGSNLKAMIDAIALGELPAYIRQVITDRPRALGLAYAKKANIPYKVLQKQVNQSVKDYDDLLAKIVEQAAPDFIVLAGFMRVLTPTFVEKFRGKILNIHPSLLPAYPGLHTHRRVLEAGDLRHGATVHVVNEKLDAGPVIAQHACEVSQGDTEETLANKVLCLEHKLYPSVLKALAEKDIELTSEGQVIFHNIAWTSST